MGFPRRGIMDSLIKAVTVSMARVLVVDDEKPIRDLIRQTLEHAGHVVIEAPDGRMALRRFRETPAALVITDILMPEQDGLGLIRELRHEFPAVKIIALSGGSVKIGFDVLEVAKRFGAVTALEKPFQLEELLRVVNNALTSE
jgi:CheY-like chemotaxis protein